jgi:glycosyltransferase involved in cell wall biosynthesis
MKICHVTSAHQRDDIRVFLKEISSLRIAGYNVTFIVADGKGNDSNNQIYDVGKAKSRFGRFFITTHKIYKLAKTLQIDLFHFHDPELIPVGIKLKKYGKKIIFDFHEDVPKQLLTKPYLNKFLLVLLSQSFAVYEKWACKHYDFIITTSASGKSKFKSITNNVEIINNYPLFTELSTDKINWDDKKYEVCYIGGISAIRGIIELINAFDYLDDISLNLAGSFNTESIENEARACNSWNKINFLGYISRAETQVIYKRSLAGIMTNLSTPHHLEAQPNKMYEYMAAGLPVIVSNFPMLAEIVKEADCGICVDPADSKAIADAISYLVNNPEKAEKMGNNGQVAIQTKYNWEIEEKKLLSIYNKIKNE